MHYKGYLRFNLLSTEHLVIILHKKTMKIQVCLRSLYLIWEVELSSCITDRKLKSQEDGVPQEKYQKTTFLLLFLLSQHILLVSQIMEFSYVTILSPLSNWWQITCSPRHNSCLKGNCKWMNTWIYYTWKSNSESWIGSREAWNSMWIDANLGIQ